MPISETVDTVVQNCPIDVRRGLYKNIVLSGGSTMFKVLNPRPSQQALLSYTQPVEFWAVRNLQYFVKIWHDVEVFQFISGTPVIDNAALWSQSFTRTLGGDWSETFERLLTIDLIQLRPSLGKRWFWMVLWLWHFNYSFSRSRSTCKWYRTKCSATRSGLEAACLLLRSVSVPLFHLQFHDHLLIIFLTMLHC